MKRLPVLHLSVGIALSLATSTSAWAKKAEGLWLFGALGGGYKKVDSSVNNTVASGASTGTEFSEVSKNGFHLLGKATTSYYWDSFVGDFSFGFNYARLAYENLDPDPIGEGREDTGINASHTMTHKNLFFELSPRFRLDENWQLGPVIQWHGLSDVGHSEVASTENKSIFHGGLHLNYDSWIGENTILRLGAQGLMDFTEASRTVYHITGLIEIGFDPFTDRPMRRKRPEKKVEPPPADAFVIEDFNYDIPSARQTAPDQVIVRLPSDKFLFDTNMSHIRNKRTRQYLRDYGRILRDNSSNWDRLLVVGHTDNRGSRKINQELSYGRAKTVALHLAEGGAPRSQMSYIGRAFDEPLEAKNNAKAWAKNRRVELKFSGVRATQDMVDQVEDLNRRYGYSDGKGRY